ncbi:enkurin-like [Phymastichus coffea]|uniref:enkurin-like n=1 Tax=Phymastichus coffea TaxID=108790 RepID=UPI00273A868D|nr:enkurin-like [Phymastichus coffea]
MAYDEDEIWEENVVKLIPKPEVKFVKSPRYRSVHSKRTREETARAKSAHKTLGLPCVGPTIRPSDFLKRRSGVRPAVSVHHVHYRIPLPGLPKWSAKKPQRPIVDFTKKNVELANQLKAKLPEFKHVDTRRGDTYELMPSGLMPVYVHKKNFGEVPPNLKRNKSAPASRRHERSSRDVIPEERPVNKKSACKYITEDERANLLKAIKKKWSELMKQFQCLPFLIDTPPKVKRKAALEDKLKQLEKDIELIENHPYIYVYDDEA